MSLSFLEKKKKELIDKLKSKGINDLRVLDAINNVKREEFVSYTFQAAAYDDNALPISNDQTISQPYTVAFMTSLLDVFPGDKILEVGTGSGYQAAILSEMGAKVYTVERIKELYENSKSFLSNLGYEIEIKLGDGSLGWKENAPYDGIIVTAATPKIAKGLISQLKIGGKLIVPVGNRKSQKMLLIERNGEETFDKKELGGFKFVPLIGKFGFND